MSFDPDTFLASSHLEIEFQELRKVELLALADHLKITEIKPAMKKSDIKKLVNEKLITMELLKQETVEFEINENLTLQLELKKMELEMKREEMKIREKEMQLQKEKEEREAQLQREKQEKEFELERLKIERGVHAQQNTGFEHPPRFDAAKNIRLVPKFFEKNVDKYFPQFEKVAENLNWPKENWTTLLQSVLTGKAANIYSAMRNEDSADYDKVKQAILKAYELVPEAYRQKFRSFKKFNGQTYVEFARLQEELFDQWLRSQKIEGKFNKLRELMLVEQFKNGLYPDLRTHLDEQPIHTLNDAAVFSDSYTLTHKQRYVSKSSAFNNNDRSYTDLNANAQYMPNSKSNQFNKNFSSMANDSSLGGRFNKNVSSTTGELNPGKFNSNVSSNRGTQSTADTGRYNKQHDDRRSAVQCSYCKKPGHVLSQCVKLKNKNEFTNPKHPVGLISDKNISVPEEQEILPCSNKIMDNYKPYLSQGSVSIDDNLTNSSPITILRDTGASQTLLLEGVLPLSDKTFTGKYVLLQVVQLGTFNVPLHRVYLQSKFISGMVTLGVCPTLPVSGISLLLGNDLASGKDILYPIVSEEAIVDESDQQTDLYPACAVTRSMSKNLDKHSQSDELPLSDTVNCAKNDSTPVAIAADEIKVPSEQNTISQQQLLVEQKKDPEIVHLVKRAIPYDETHNEAECFYIKDGILMRKWRPTDSKPDEEWKIMHQIVVPKIYRRDILNIAHETPLSGHLGVNKTCKKILDHFYWPKLKRDVAQFCKSCHTCQVVGKPNQTLPHAHLKPIPAFKEPFTRIIIDCVGPLPKTRSGNQYLLTIMCSSTRFPEAIPLRNIKAKTIVKALTKFFCLVGLPLEVQCDQGSNFMSNIFQQVLNELGITQYPSTAYHPQSQGALERFHQTLKSMLKKYCFQFEKDWDEGVPFVLFAAREAVQDSLGFSPFQLIFGHTVRGPLQLLKEKWMIDNQDLNLLDYVSNFKEKLFNAFEIAQQNLKQSQSKMKHIYDKNAITREFKPGDKVLLFLPIPGHSLQAKYFGPYEIKAKLNDLNYVVHTPGRRREKRVCHINMIKEYFDRNSLLKMIVLIPMLFMQLMIVLM